MSVLAIHDVALRIGTADAIKGASLTAPTGKVTALLGPAGSGKTALIRAIAGLESPRAGTIRLGDETLLDAAAGIDVAPDKRGVGLMVQSGDLWPKLSARDNLAFGARFREGAAEARVLANRMLVQHGLADIANRMPARLSIAEQRRVALLRALICEPKLLLLDEPLGGDRNADEWNRLRQFLGETGITTVVATRDRIEAFVLADHVAVINAGSIEQEGTPSEIFTKPATPFVASFMAPCNRIEGTLVEKAGLRAFLDVKGARIGGVNCTSAELGATCTGVIRIDRMLLGGGPGINRLRMQLKAQTFLGERWEITFVNDTLAVRAHQTAPLRYEFYHLEFPPDALWIY